LVIVKIGSCFLPKPYMDFDPLVLSFAPMAGDDKCVPPCSTFSIEMESYKLFAWADLEL
jgi:hypothetical protein